MPSIFIHGDVYKSVILNIFSVLVISNFTDLVLMIHLENRKLCALGFWEKKIVSNP